MNFNNIILTSLQIPHLGRESILKIFNNLDTNSFNENDFFDYLKTYTNFKTEKQKNIINLLTKEKFNNYLKYANEIIGKSEKENIKLLNIKDEKYPSSLKKIKKPAALLFIFGNVDAINQYDKNIAVVGTRNPTNEGNRLAYVVGSYLSKKKYNVISGLAKGCDSQSHAGSFEGEGVTVAVLPGGINKDYYFNSVLFKNIIKKNGCLVSEYSFNEPPEKYKYIERNRLQAGLSRSLILIESKINGGSMTTVNFSIEQNKKVFVFKKENFVNEQLGNKEILDKNNVYSFKSIEDLAKFIN